MADEYETIGENGRSIAVNFALTGLSGRHRGHRWENSKMSPDGEKRRRWRAASGG
jgi:hypothetical protein